MSQRRREVGPCRVEVLEGRMLLAGVSGAAVNDANDNGVIDAGENGLAGWTVYVDYNGDSIQQAGEPSALTASDGTFKIGGVPAGSYFVREKEQAGFRARPAAVVATVSAGRDATGINFANSPKGRIVGTAYYDLSASGTRDAGEPGLSGWGVYIDANNNGVWDSASERRVLTDAAGKYVFTNLSPHAYKVREIVPGNWSSEPVNRPGNLWSPNVSAGSIVRDKDFANTPAPAISITSVPTYASQENLSGLVAHVASPQNYRVAPYIYVDGSGWWSKPYASSSTVPVNADGTFTVDVTTGGLDSRAIVYAVALVAQGNSPPVALGDDSLPRDVGFIATASRERYGRTVSFSGRTWGLKEAPLPVGPGGNRFSCDPADVSVDGGGKLHLSAHQYAGTYYSTEAILTQSLGYGRYLFQTSSRVDLLDSNAVLGLFTWDSFGDPALPDGRRNHEIDFEDSRWSNPASGTNSQFVVQPWTGAGNITRYALPNLAGDAKLTRILTWRAGSLRFQVIRGHHTFSDFTAADVLQDWTYTTDAAAGHYVPEPGQSRIHLNLWLNSSAPAGDGVLEVTVDRFDYAP